MAWEPGSSSYEVGDRSTWCHGEVLQRQSRSLGGPREEVAVGLGTTSLFGVDDSAACVSGNSTVRKHQNQPPANPCPPFFALALPGRLSVVFVLGVALGAAVNWAIYRLAWNPREISPWGPAPPLARPRRRTDRIPLVGWLGLRRESAIHGPGFWMRPLLIELGLGLALAALYWWEVDQQQLVVPQVNSLLRLELWRAAVGPVLPLAAPLASPASTHAVFCNHFLLIGLMAAASFIDIDEKIIPDEVTVPGTLLGLLLAALLPMGFLPHVAAERAVPAVVGEPIALPANLAGVPMQIEPVTASAPHQWPEVLGGTPHWESLLVGPRVLVALVLCAHAAHMARPTWCGPRAEPDQPARGPRTAQAAAGGCRLDREPGNCRHLVVEPHCLDRAAHRAGRDGRQRWYGLDCTHRGHGGTAA